MSTSTLTRTLGVLGLTAVAWLPATQATAAPGTAPMARQDASIRPFVRDWTGHTRDLDLRAGGTVVESIYSGCCDHVVDVTLRVSHGRGDGHHGSVFARVTRVHVFDHSAYSDAEPPYVGESGRLPVRRGVLHERFTRTVYCTPAAGARGVCGA